MSPPLVRLDTHNYRCLADLSLELKPINIFFGANGSGKSTILDAIWFIRDCATNGVEFASSNRGHGIGMVWDGAKDGEQLGIVVATEQVEYFLTMGISSGRIEPFASEILHSYTQDRDLIQRNPGSDKVTLYHQKSNQFSSSGLREPEKLSLGMYLDFNQSDLETTYLYRLLRSVGHYHSRSFDFHWLKYKGSDMSYETRLEGQGRNAWSVLRNLHDRRSIDPAFDTIMKYMTESFPDFKDLLLEQTGPTTVYAHFLRQGNRKPLYVSGASDGHLQMLLLLTALFSEGSGRQVILLFDEPELSLHPRALSVLARAVNEAASWSRQVLIATHSPALLSHFEPTETLATSLKDGRTVVNRLSDMAELKDLLQEYPTGSLYMAELVGAQGNHVAVPTGE